MAKLEATIQTRLGYPQDYSQPKSAEFCGQPFCFYIKLADFGPYLLGVGKHNQMPAVD